MTGRQSHTDRGQVVLLAALVLVVALVPMALAYVQLGYDGDRGASLDDDPAAATERALDRAVHDVASNLSAGEWDERQEVAATFRDRLEPTVTALERAGLGEGTVINITVDGEQANEWADEHCPGGPNRAFGECTVTEDIVVQERDGVTYVVAVPIEISVSSPEETTRLTTTIPVGTGR